MIKTWKQFNENWMTRIAAPILFVACSILSTSCDDKVGKYRTEFEEYGSTVRSDSIKIVDIKPYGMKMLMVTFESPDGFKFTTTEHKSKTFIVPNGTFELNDYVDDQGNSKPKKTYKN